MEAELGAIAKLIRSLNDHLPSERKSLGELLMEEKPRVACRDGSTHRMKKEELQTIEKLIGLRWRTQADRLRLPILIEMSPDCGRSTAKIRGSVYCDIVQAILERNRETVDEMVIFGPEIRAIRKKLPSTTQYAFIISGS